MNTKARPPSEQSWTAGQVERGVAGRGEAQTIEGAPCTITAGIINGEMGEICNNKSELNGRAAIYFRYNVVEPRRGALGWLATWPHAHRGAGGT